MLLFIISLIINLSSCSSSIPASDSSITNSNLKNLSWILGEWQSEGKDFIVIESWEKTDDFRYTGKSIKIKNGDTTVLELLELKQIGSDVFYIADVKHNADPVKFKLIASDKLLTEEGKRLQEFSALFENRTHDFPQQINYVLKGDALTATISGPGKDGKIKSIDFNFKRK